METMNPDGLPPPIQNLYAQISIAPPGRFAFIAGQVAMDEKGNLIGKGSYAEQATQCFTNIRTAIAALDASSSDVARMTINVVNHRPELIPVIFEAGLKVFGDQWPRTASILLGVQALGLPDWLIEIDAIVALPVQR
ncbi:RidA family protein [Paraburkholderia sediminicola]|uniref:RidA family protein n=1 Tax=Paraburkholderia sediminicola TaxID=458836 RepID=UPI0038BC377E